MDVFTILISTVILISTWIYFKHRKLPPGPWGLPIIGSAFRIDKLKPYVSFTELAKKYGPIYGLKLGSVYTVVLSDADLIRTAFAKEEISGRAPLHVTHGIMKGYGLICAEGDLWRNQRKFVAVNLRSFGMVKHGPTRDNLEEIINNGVYEFIHKVRTEINKEGNSIELNPSKYLRHSLGNVINYIVFGRKWSENDETWKWLLERQEEGPKLMGVSVAANFISWLQYLPPAKDCIRFLIEGKNKTHEIYKQIISDYQKSKADDESVYSKHFIDAFLRQRDNCKGTKLEQFYSDEQFCHLLADLFGAGLDTTMATLRWFLLFTSIDIDFQMKLRKEIDDVVVKRPVKLADLPQLPLMEAALAETQRIRSIVPVGIPHGTTKDTKLEGYLIPRGSMVMPLQWAVHMDDSKWTNPEQFQPERFLNSEGQFVKPDNFIPFQIGKRVCIGDELGKMLLFLFGSAIVQHFKYYLVSNSQINMDGDCGITLAPFDYDLNFTNRDLEFEI